VAKGGHKPAEKANCPSSNMTLLRGATEDTISGLFDSIMKILHRLGHYIQEPDRDCDLTE